MRIWLLSVLILTSCGYSSNSNLSPQPITGTKSFLNNIAPNYINQGLGNGDCWFIAMVASIAKTNPNIIREAIKTTEDPDIWVVGLYDITNDYQPVYITVSNNTLDTNGTTIVLDDYENPVIWPAILYNAFVILNNETHFNSNYDGDAGMYGGNSSEAYSTITGTLSRQLLFGKTVAYQTVYSFLIYANNTPMVLTTNSNINDANIISLHTYTVMDVENTDYIVLRNPWGYVLNNSDGLQVFNLNTILNNFNQITIPDTLIFNQK